MTRDKRTCSRHATHVNKQWRTAFLSEACSAERVLTIVGVRSLLNGSVRYSSEASACEQSRAFASAEQASEFPTG